MLAHVAETTLSEEALHTPACRCHHILTKEAELDVKVSVKRNGDMLRSRRRGQVGWFKAKSLLFSGHHADLTVIDHIIVVPSAILA